MSRDLQDDEYYKSSGGQVPIKWTAPEVCHRIEIANLLGSKQKQSLVFPVKSYTIYIQITMNITHMIIPSPQ